MGAYNNDHERRERAYYIWERQGRPEGRSMDHWLEAEPVDEVDARQEALDQALVGSFPASDLPASTGPITAGKPKPAQKAKV